MVIGIMAIGRATGFEGRHHIPAKSRPGPPGALEGDNIVTVIIDGCCVV